jgi:uncharacterized protein YjbI with pentapeptide repeats
MRHFPRFIIFLLLSLLYNNSLFAQIHGAKKTVNLNITGKVLDDSLIYIGDTIFIHIDSGGDRFSKVNFTHSKFLNRADFSAETFAENANFSFAEFRDTVDFRNAEFHGAAIFDSVIFKKITSFSSAKFSKTADFRHVVFNNTADLFKSTFEDQAVFNGRFEKQLDLDSSKFLDSVSFFRSKFGGSAFFEHDTFKKAVYFQRDTLQKDVSFWQSEFKNGINFFRSIFQKKVDLEEADIQKILILSNVSTSDSTKFYFDYAKLPDLISFANVSNIHNDIDLTAANFSRSKLYSASARRWHYINLFDSDIPKIKIDYEHFRLCFFSGTNGIDNEDIAMGNIIKDNDDNTIKIHDKEYLRTNPKLFDTLLKIDAFRDYLTQVFPTAKLTDTVVKDFVGYCLTRGFFPQALSRDEILSTYEKVLKNFELNGQMESYKALDIEYRDFENDGWFNINHLWNRYGYDKEWIFYWTAGFLLLFTLITSFFIGDFNRKIEDNGVYYLENITLDHPGEKFFVLKRFIHAFVYTSSVFFLLGLKVENLNFRRAAVIYILLVYAMGILCLGYVANFVLAK